MTDDLAEITDMLKRANAQLQRRLTWQHVVWAWTKAVGFIGLVAAVIVMALVLSRRSPVLEYLSCHDQRLDAELHDFRLLIDSPGRVDPKVRAQIDRDDDALQLATEAGKPGACPSLPNSK